MARGSNWDSSRLCTAVEGSPCFPVVPSLPNFGKTALHSVSRKSLPRPVLSSGVILRKTHICVCLLSKLQEEGPVGYGPWISLQAAAQEATEPTKSNQYTILMLT